jgi:HK97 family phage major capsid protein
MTLKELREIRAEKVKLQSHISGKVETWTDEEEKNFDAVTREIELLDKQVRAMEISEANLLRLKQRAPGPKPPLGCPNMQDRAAGSEGPTFTMSNGRQIRALLPSERMTATADDASDEPVDLGNCLRALVVGREDALNDAERRAMQGTNNVQGGHLLTPQLSTMVVDLARSASVCLSAGALTIPMDTSEMTIARQVGDPTAHWRAETAAVPSSDVTFDAVFLRARTLAAIVPVSIELMEDAANASSLISNALQQSMGVAIDKCMLSGYGTGEARPTGLKFTDGVNSQTSCGTPTNSTAYAKLIAGVGQILTANFPGQLNELAWIATPRERKNFAALVDSTYQPLREPDMISQIPKFTTTSLGITETGDYETGGAESTGFIGHFPAMVLGARTSGVNIRVLESGSVIDATGTTWNSVSQLMKLVVAYIRVDCTVLRPTWFTKLTGWTTG